MEGRQILDATLIENENGYALLRRKESGLLCKLNIEKADDYLD